MTSDEKIDKLLVDVAVLTERVETVRTSLIPLVNVPVQVASLKSDFEELKSTRAIGWKSITSIALALIGSVTAILTTLLRGNQ
jgi:hypothetical protein